MNNETINVVRDQLETLGVGPNVVEVVARVLRLTERGAGLVVRERFDLVLNDYEVQSGADRQLRDDVVRALLPITFRTITIADAQREAYDEREARRPPTAG